MVAGARKGESALPEGKCRVSRDRMRTWSTTYVPSFRLAAGHTRVVCTQRGLIAGRGLRAALQGSVGLSVGLRRALSLLCKAL